MNGLMIERAKPHVERIDFSNKARSIHRSDSRSARRSLGKGGSRHFLREPDDFEIRSRSFPRRDGFSSRPPELRLLELEVSNDHLHLLSVGWPSMGSRGRQRVPIRVVEIAQPEVDVEPLATRCRDEVT